MTTFHVGQRVRVNLPEVSTHGRECVVIALGIPGRCHGRDYIGIQVDIPHPDQRYKFCVYEADDLVPLTGPNEADIAAAKALLNNLPAYVPGLAHV